MKVPIWLAQLKEALGDVISLEKNWVLDSPPVLEATHGFLCCCFFLEKPRTWHR